MCLGERLPDKDIEESAAPSANTSRGSRRCLRGLRSLAGGDGGDVAVAGGELLCARGAGATQLQQSDRSYHHTMEFDRVIYKTICE